MSHTGSLPGGVRAVDRAMALLLAFAGKPPQPLSDLARAAALDRGTARRLLLTLMRCGFVVQDPTTQRYGLGDAVRMLSSSVVEGFSLRSIAHPVLSALAAELKVTSFLSVYRDQTAVCLDRFHDMQGMQLHWWPVGGTMPLNCGAAPKLLLAWQGAAEIDRALAQDLVALTPHSIVAPKALRTQLSTIRARGWEWAVDDVSLGLTAVAVPVLDRERRLICAASITGLSAQMATATPEFYINRLRAAASDIRAGLIPGGADQDR